MDGMMLDDAKIKKNRKSFPWSIWMELTSGRYLLMTQASLVIANIHFLQHVFFEHYRRSYSYQQVICNT